MDWKLKKEEEGNRTTYWKWHATNVTIQEIKSLAWCEGKGNGGLALKNLRN